MRSVLMATVGALALTSTAFAADRVLPAAPAKPPVIVRPIYNWTGFYVGGHVGYGWAKWDGALVYDPGGQGGFSLPRSLTGNGFLGGGQIGFNHQVGAFVWGVEADAAWAHITGHADFPLPAVDYVWHIDNSVNWLATIRGRIGFTAGERLLLYVTGGWAFAGAKSIENVTAGTAQGFPATVVTATASASENHNGWTAGAGAEYALGDHWSVKLEYLYADLGRRPYHYVGTAYPLNATACAVVAGNPVVTYGAGPYGAAGPTCNFAHTTDNFPAKLIVQNVKLGINYRF